ncbi:MAG TPA: GNAT family N-acetyltransferase [Arenibacter sp.]|nr:GNAT family N-acetyltransferase [Arenibacter sp.]
MERIALSDTDHIYFSKAWELYEASFPKEERRTITGQNRIFGLEPYHFEVIVMGDAMVGLLLWWGFKEFVFIEHFATMPNVRGKGYGGKILGEFLEAQNRRVVLEVEPPEDDLKKRRIAFYQKLGFVFNPHFYKQPPMQKGCGPLQLYLMSWPTEITKESVDLFQGNYHPLIYDQEALS